jgi:hypothetical protein
VPDDEDIRREKQRLFLERRELIQKGVRYARELTMDDSIEDFRYDVDYGHSYLGMNDTVAFVRNGIPLVLSMLEMANNKFGPFLAIQNWSTEIAQNIRSEPQRWNNVLEQLYRRYWRKGSINPILQLGWMIFGSMLVYHFKQKFMGTPSTEGSVGPPAPNVSSGSSHPQHQSAPPPPPVSTSSIPRDAFAPNQPWNQQQGFNPTAMPAAPTLSQMSVPPQPASMGFVLPPLPIQRSTPESVPSARPLRKLQWQQEQPHLSPVQFQDHEETKDEPPIRELKSQQQQHAGLPSISRLPPPQVIPSVQQVRAPPPETKIATPLPIPRLVIQVPPTPLGTATQTRHMSHEQRTSLETVQEEPEVDDQAFDEALEQNPDYVAQTTKS